MEDFPVLVVMHEQKVQAGVAFLDEKFPEGWRDRISLTTLHMMDNCILEHVTGTLYSRAVEDLGFTPQQQVEYGFDLGPASDLPELIAGYQGLLEAWVNELRPTPNIPTQPTNEDR